MMSSRNLVLAVIAAAALVACSNTPIAPTQAPVSSAHLQSATQAPGSTRAGSHVATVTLDPLDDPNSTLAARSVYFGYDDFTVGPKYQPLVQAHGQYLAVHPKAQVRVEGNADERGSSEYNLALGDKRAQVLAHQLELMGARASQVEAVSYGKERPRATGHDEAAWAENRRDDIRYVKR